jgi:hypothetical protein
MTSGAQVTGGQVADDQNEFARLRKEVLDHVPYHVSRDEIQREVHGGGAVGRLNSRIAVLITNAVGTMWAAYAFTFLALISLPAAIDAFNSGQIIVAVSWLSQSFLQLVLLPIIIVGQNVISAAQDKRSEHDHHTLTVLHRINVQQLKLLEQQQQILDRLEAMPGSSRTAAG